MSHFSFGKYANPPYDIITKELIGNKYFHATTRKFIIITSIIIFIFFSGFIIFFLLTFIIFTLLSKKYKQLNKIRDIICYGIDYSIMKSLKQKGSITLTPNLLARLPSSEQIKHDLESIPKSFKSQGQGINHITGYRKTRPVSTVHSQKSYEMPELNFDFGDEKEIKKIGPQGKIEDKKQYSSERKSIFNDYVSVKDIFKNMKNR